MKKFHFSALCFIALLFLVQGCRKSQDYNLENIPTVTYDPGVKITTPVAGTVLNESGQELSDVTITIGATSVKTDINGRFIIPKASISSKAGLVTATKDGYFGGSRTIIPKENVINNVSIQLVKKVKSGSFSNSNGGTITPTNGGTISFPANAIVTKAGGAYSGTVSVSAYFLDPTKKDAYEKMPGSLRGVTTDNNEQALSSYGMMAVELTGSNGEALQLATGKSASLTFPIAASLNSSAPASIPLWYFDETNGMWTQQGTATKVGNTYVGDVAHFTWWNCDYGGGPITYTVTFVDQNGNPINNQHVYMLPSDSSRGGGHGYTASDGSLTGNIPTNTSITVTMWIYTQCGAIAVYTAQVGPFTTSTNGGTVVVNMPTSITSSTATFTGTVVDCNKKPITSGYASISLGNNYYQWAYIYNGVVNASIIRCSGAPAATATINVYDYNSQTNITPVTISNVTAGTYSFGQVSACGIPNGINYTVNVVDQNGTPLNGYCNYSAAGSPTVNSWFNGAAITNFIPANVIVKRVITVYNACGGVTVDSAYIGPFNSDFNAGNVTFNMPQQNVLHITGTVVDCNGNPLTNGTAMAFSTMDSSVRNATINNGSFSIPITNCSGTTLTYSLVVMDSKNSQQNTTPVTVTITNSDVAVGQVSACGLSTSEFFNYTFNSSTSKTMDSYSTYSQGNYTSFYGNSKMSGDNINGSFNGASVATFPLSNFYYYSNQRYYNFSSGNTTITEYGATGQFIAGTFTAIVSDSLQGSNTITGSFRIRR